MTKKMLTRMEFENRLADMERQGPGAVASFTARMVYDQCDSISNLETRMENIERRTAPLALIGYLIAWFKR